MMQRIQAQQQYYMTTPQSKMKSAAAWYDELALSSRGLTCSLTSLFLLPWYATGECRRCQQNVESISCLILIPTQAITHLNKEIDTLPMNNEHYPKRILSFKALLLLIIKPEITLQVKKRRQSYLKQQYTYTYHQTCITTCAKLPP